MTDLQSLHRALSEAESGGRELDAGIAWHVDGYSGATIDALRDGSPIANAIVPCYTTSLDAITSLIERKLPGADFESGTCGPHVSGYSAVISDHYPESGEPWRVDCEHAPTEPLARAIALVSALIAQESEK